MNRYNVELQRAHARGAKRVVLGTFQRLRVTVNSCGIPVPAGRLSIERELPEMLSMLL